MGMGTVHPVVVERLVRLARRLSLVAAAQDIDRLRWKELVPKVAAHLLLVRELVAHDEDLTAKPVHSMGVDEYTHKRL